MRLPLADGKPIIDKPINDRRRRKRGGCGKNSVSFGTGVFSISSPPFLFFARTTTYYAQKKSSVLIDI